MNLARATNFCWFFFKCSLVLGLIGGLFCALFLRDRVDREIRDLVQKQLSEAYPNLEVTVDSAALVKDKGIEIRGVAISERGAEGPRAELVYLDRMFLTCGTQWKELISGKPKITRIVVSGPTLHATRRHDGTYSVEKLLPMPDFGGSHPEIVIENATVEVFDPVKLRPSTWVARDVNFTLRAPDPSSENPHVREIEGTFSANHLALGDIKGSYDTSTGAWSVEGAVDGIHVSPELCDDMPEPLATRLGMLASVRGRGKLQYQVEYRPEPESGPAETLPQSPRESPYHFMLTMELKQGELDYPRVPYRLNISRAKVRVGNVAMTDKRANRELPHGGIIVDEFVASVGDASVWIWGHQAGFALGQSPLYCEANVRQLTLDNRVLNSLHSLPESLDSLKVQWDKYRPLGLINADATVTFDGQHWNPEVHVECVNVSFTHHRFDYRLLKGKGSVDLEDDRVQVHLTARSRSQPVYVDADIDNATSAPVGKFRVHGQNLLLDQDMIDALQKEQRTIVKSFDPHGHIDFEMDVRREHPEDIWHKHIVLDLKGCRLTFKNFPYPLIDVWGRIEAQDKEWTFHDNMIGRNDTGVVRVEEGWMRPVNGEPMLYLRLTGENIELEEELRNAHPENIRRIWNDLQPKGKFDATAAIIYRHKTDEQVRSGQPKKTQVNVVAYPHRDSASIQPVSFPYRMSLPDGMLIYRDGRLTIQGRAPGKRFRVRHGQVELAANCYCDFLPDGSWEFHVEDLTADRLLVDNEFLSVLPPKLGEAIRVLNPTGPNDRREGFGVDLRGGFVLKSGQQLGDPVRSSWDVRLDFAQGGIDCGVKLENLHGGVHLLGQSDGTRFVTFGELDIAAATYKDYQFTEVRGPMMINNDRVVFGSWGQQERRRLLGSAAGPPRRLSAELFGGTIYSDALVTLDANNPSYRLRADLVDADLARCAQETIAGRGDLQGKVAATVNLWGSGQSLNGMHGNGVIRLREANIYKLPVMLALLKALSLREPEPTAFHKSNIAFSIQANHIYFKPINFYGDAISLLGEGHMDMNSQKIDLTFHSLVGNDEIHLPILREVMGGASQQILKIHVGGTLQDPETKKEVLPFLNEVWQRLQQELQVGPGQQSPLFQQRQAFPNLRRPNATRR